ncbi:septal ring lytic transglycosylase RlpA family protein [Actinomadura rupiterrae]|uniref:septal ring lytic transglycosylase RlpA family protein n=1 Tax=Actinomadura rupiterrae TaxID=559627 RepID=UPI0027E2669E|nr:septal ring lytic transglycosylase RlpA family protein [Actinomadura rupiterrae]MCP2340307.1 rare lipoprotein A [Actinomadura rupiterrae]
MGKHRPKIRLRTLLVASGVAVAVLAAGAAALLMGGGSGGSANAAQTRQLATPPTQPQSTQTPLADAPRTTPSRASRGEPRPPVPKPVKTSDSPKPKPKKKTYNVVSSGSCEASSYGEGQETASGEPFNPNALTAAHKTLPFGSKVRVTNKDNGESVIVRINDRGPYVGGRCLDLSTAAMKAVDGMGAGVIPVRYEVLSRG